MIRTVLSYCVSLLLSVFISFILIPLLYPAVFPLSEKSAKDSLTPSPLHYFPCLLISSSPARANLVLFFPQFVIKFMSYGKELSGGKKGMLETIDLLTSLFTPSLVQKTIFWVTIQDFRRCSFRFCITICIYSFRAKYDCSSDFFSKNKIIQTQRFETPS